MTHATKVLFKEEHDGGRDLIVVVTGEKAGVWMGLRGLLILAWNWHGSLCFEASKMGTIESQQHQCLQKSHHFIRGFPISTAKGSGMSTVVPHDSILGPKTVEENNMDHCLA
ncbi:unnamed protein product [Lupinus luteus]|uniref:Uncharacterized protein n=1 Tax=Lupinus luteus TaxID=3873 RepID=A0AAV1YD72_LUPLU